MLLKSLTETILNSKSSPLALNDAILEFENLLSGIVEKAGISDKTKSKRETLLSSGLAISSYNASTCIKDTFRTVKYIRALNEAVLQLKKNINDRPIHILYAGSGPFAPFAFSIISQFSPTEIQFTILDLHEESTTSVRVLAKELGVETYFTKIETNDAVLYKHNGNYPIDILIVECLNKALLREPQVPICANLSTQMPDYGIMIPESIRIDAYMIDPNVELSFVDKDEESGNVTYHVSDAKKHRIYIGKVMDFNIELAKVLQNHLNTYDINEGLNVDVITLKVPHRDKALDTIMFGTTITLFGAHKLEEYESGITHPYFHIQGERIPKDAEVLIGYAINQYPGFYYQVVSPKPQEPIINIIQ